VSVFENYSYSYAISDGPGAGVDGRLLLPAIEALQIKYAASVPAFLKINIAVQSSNNCRRT